MKLTILFALTILTAAAPAFASEFHAHSVAAHMRPQLFHDRSPHVHNRAAQPHRS